ncbi:MAG: hypothetical protein HYV14_12160 [Elusimicrobia bacterium]|nr:hypothetical protein [Elusimicrobiota bacterium]
MTKPLVACLALVIAFQASAQTARRSPAEAKAELSRKFAKGADVAGLDFTGQAEPLVLLLDQAKYVQAGRESGDEKETHIAFIRSVARRLGARPETAAELYGDRVRPGRAGTVAPAEIAAREALAEDMRRNPGISEEKKKRLNRNLTATSEYLKAVMNGDSASIGGPASPPAELNVTAVSAPADGPQYDSTGQRNWSRVLPRVQPLSLVVSPTPSPAGPLQSASAGMMSWASLSAYFDWERGKQVAAEAYTGTLNYAKKMGAMCYRFFKQALIDAGVIDVPNPQSTGLIGLRPGAARMFSQDVRKNPKILDEMGYRQVDLAKASNDPASVPDGSLLIYAAGCSFANDVHGHAEITVGPGTYALLRARNRRLRELPTDANEVRVCHFSCTKRSMPFLRTYGKQGCLKMYVPVKSS